MGFLVIYSWKTWKYHGILCPESAENPAAAYPAIQVAAESTSKDMTTVFHKKLYCRSIEVESSFTRNRSERQSQHLKRNFS